MDLRNILQPPVVVTYLLFCVFGIGSWIAINGIWAESAVLILTLPECGRLPAILDVVVQIANVGPLTYTAMRYLFRRRNWKHLYLEVTTVFILVGVGTASCGLLAIFWSDTASVFGSTHSVTLIGLSFALALVDCTSSVVFIPFMKHFPAKYLSALYIGEGMSGVLPSVVAVSQGFVNDSLSCMDSYPGISTLGINFSPNVYFVFLAAMMMLCGVAFVAINLLPMVKKQMVTHQQFLDDDNPSQSVSSTESSSLADSDTQLDKEIEESSLTDDSEREDSAKLSGDNSMQTPLIDSPEEVIKDLRLGDFAFQTFSSRLQLGTVLMQYLSSGPTSLYSFAWGYLVFSLTVF